MSPRDALGVLQQAAAKFLGTLEDHNTLQEAAKVLEAVVAKQEQVAPANAETAAEPQSEAPAEEAAEEPVEPAA